MSDNQPKTPPGLSCPVCHERFSPDRDGTVAWAHHVGVKCKIPKGKPYPPLLFGTDGDLRAKISAAFDAAEAGRLRPNAQAIARDSNGSYDVLSDLPPTSDCGAPAPEAIRRQLALQRQFANVDLVCGEPAGHADDCVATVLANFGQPTMRVRWARKGEPAFATVDELGQHKGERHSKPNDHVAGHVGADGRFYAHREIEKGEVFKARIGAEAPWLEPKGGLCAACGIVSSAQPPALDPPGWMVVDFPAGSDRREEKQLCPPCGEKVAKFIAHLSTPMLHEEDLL